MYKTKIKNVEIEIKNVEREIKKTNSKTIGKILNNEVERLNKQLERLKLKQEEFDKIDGLSVDEILKKADKGELKINKDTLQSLLIEKSHNDFELAVKNDGMGISPVTVMDRRLKKIGYIIAKDGEYYLLCYNHLSVCTTTTDNIISFKVNNNHLLFKSDNNLKAIKEFIKFIFNKFGLSLEDSFTLERKEWGVNIKNNGDYIRTLLLALKIDVKNKKVIIPYENITLGDEYLMDLIKELKY